MATKPYHLKSVDVHFYSLEEILYFYKNHEILIDRNLMEEDFVSWVKEDLHCPVLAEKLHQLIAGQGSLAMFMEVLIQQVNFFEEDEKTLFLNKLVQMEDKNEFERRKVLADQMMEREKYEAAILEYHRILKGKENVTDEDELLAKVWHNLGCCYGRLFLFEQAMECFKTAYSYKQFIQTQDAVAFLVKQDLNKDTMKADEDCSFVDLLEHTDKNKREHRYAQLKERMDQLTRSTL